MVDVLSGPVVTVQLLVLDRFEETSDMARYYVLTVEATLFGDTALVREWGRIGVSCRRRLDLYPNKAAAKVALDTWLSRKSKRGYVLRDACRPQTG